MRLVEAADDKIKEQERMRDIAAWKARINAQGPAKMEKGKRSKSRWARFRLPRRPRVKSLQFTKLTDFICRWMSVSMK